VPRVRRLALRLVLPLTIAAVAMAAVLLVPGDSSSGGTRADAAVAKPIVDPQGTPARVPERPYVVLIVMDELPGDALLDATHRIDPVRYPSIAALAANGTWYRNAWSKYDSTTKAVPLILDGMAPRLGTGPSYRDHPHSIFELLGRRGYRIVTSQEAEAMCAPRWCPGASPRPPAIVPNLQGGRPQRFERFIHSIRPGRPTFWFKHALLPHKPYLFLPSGHRTRNAAGDPLEGLDTVPGFYDEFVTRHNEQRFLLQVGFVDRLLGKLFARLRQQGMFDKTLVAITADHGLAWQVGVPTRRSVDEHNVQEITPVPLIVKAPGQRRGQVSDALVSTLDVTPTLANVLGLRLPYRADGHPASSRVVQRRRVVSLPNRELTKTITISAKRWEALRRAVVRRRLRQFGSGVSGLFTGIGPHRELLGQAVAGEQVVAAAGAAHAKLANAGAYAAVRRSSGVVPTQVAGDLRGGRANERRDLALAVNGRIEAVGRSFYLRGDRVEHFALNVPETTLPDGHDDVALYEVLGDGRLRPLAQV
jgi:hypothetical protein